MGRRKYDLELQRAGHATLREGVPIAQIARELSIDVKMLYSCRRVALPLPLRRLAQEQ